jgi:uncharacterized protein (TIGR02246 family)
MDNATALFNALHDAWNARDAHAMASLLTNDGVMIGFDGSTMRGRREVETELMEVFASHETAAYVGKIRNVRAITDEVCVVDAVAAMVPRGRTTINPDVTAVQMLVAVREVGRWNVALFQNTPAAFHGNPEAKEALDRELQELVRSRRTGL